MYPGEAGWRWTAPSFAVRLDPPAQKAAYFEMDFSVPEELLAGASAVTVTAKINGAEAARATHAKPGQYLLARPVAEQLLARSPAEIEVSVDRQFTDAATARAQGLIVVWVALHEYEQTAEFRDAQMAQSRQMYEEVVRQRNLKMPAEKQREIMTLFHGLPIWESMRFHNVRIIKNPLDLWMMQQIAWEVQPDFVVETGTWFGGSALYWAHTLAGMGLENARVVTVDIQDLTNQGASADPLWKHVDFLLGDSADPTLVERIARRVRGQRVIVNLDSDHTMQHVLKELRLYAPLVSKGSYIAIEDTHLDGVPTHPEQGPGPMAAVRRFLAEGGARDFEQDFAREAMVMTSYPGGWLRRK